MLVHQVSISKEVTWRHGSLSSSERNARVAIVAVAAVVAVVALLVVAVVVVQVLTHIYGFCYLRLQSTNSSFPETWGHLFVRLSAPFRVREANSEFRGSPKGGSAEETARYFSAMDFRGDGALAFLKAKVVKKPARILTN